MSNLLADAKIAFSILSLAYALGQDLAPGIAVLFQTLYLGKELTPEQRAALISNHSALSATLQAAAKE